MNVDSRGVLRGSCAAEGCHCIGYDGGQSSKKCTNCGHPPGKHNKSYGNLKQPSSTTDTSQFSAVTNQSHPHGATLQVHDVHNYSLRSQTGPISVSGSYYTASQSPLTYGPSSAQHSYHHHYPGDYHHQHQRQSLPQCEAAGCTRPVYFDFNLPRHLPAFKYCSPECRDKTLLPMERSKLNKELDGLRETLKAAALTLDAVTEPTKKPSYEPTVAHIGTSSSSRTTPEGGRQRTVQVKLDKDRMKRFGLILSRDMYNSDKTHGFVIVGAIKDSPVYSKVKDGTIRIFDVIESVGDRSADTLQSMYKEEPQKCFDNHMKNKTIVTLLINRSISLPPISSTLEFAQRQYVYFTHVVALRYVQTVTEVEHYGMTLEDLTYLKKVSVSGIAHNSPAFSSGVLACEEIRMYAFASQSTIEDSQVVGTKPFAMILNNLFKAQNSKRHVILLIRGYGPSTYTFSL